MISSLRSKGYVFFLNRIRLSWNLKSFIYRNISELITKPYQNIELLPSFSEIDFIVKCIGISNLNKSQILKYQSNIWNTRRPEKQNKVDFEKLRFFPSNRNFCFDFTK